MTVRGLPAPARERDPAPALQLEIVYRPLSCLTLYKDNPRQHSKRQIEMLAASMGSYGFVAPILTDEHGVIIAGHARYLAAKLRGMAEVPAIALSHLSEGARRKLRIADNKHSDNSRFDIAMLKAEVAAIIEQEEDVKVDWDSEGYEIGELDIILAEAPLSAEDEIPAAPEIARAKHGQIIRLGLHRVGCGDARDEAFLKRLLAGELADAAFQDVPYNLSIAGHVSRAGKHREFPMASGEMSDPEFIAFLAECLALGARYTRDGGVHFICIDHHHIDQLMTAAAPIYNARLNVCVWNKSNAGMGSLYRSKHELIVVYRVGATQHLNNVQLGRYGRSRTNVWDYPSVNTVGSARAKELDWHPTTKPVAMVADAIKDVTKPGDIVLDTFLGSGTSLIAAERVGRRLYGIELDPHYVDITVERWVNMTGGTPEIEVEASVWPAPNPTVVTAAAWGQPHA